MFPVDFFVAFLGELEQKRRAQSFLSGQEPKAGKLVRHKVSTDKATRVSSVALEVYSDKVKFE